MKNFFRSVFFGSLILSNHILLADTIDSGNEANENDVRAIREWLNTKRQVTVKEKGGALSISGEVRTEFQAINETSNGKRQRGEGGAFDALANRSYDIEADIIMDYRTERTWAAIKLKFDNAAGMFGGTKDKVSLDRAYFGGRFIDEDYYTLDCEVGRRKLTNIFDSKVEFDSLFDGILLSYDAGFENVGNFYTHAGVFVIDERFHHYGYVGEVGLLNIANSGFYSKYSLIDWDTKNYPEMAVLNKKKENGIDKITTYTDPDQRFNFLISQLLFGYRWIPVKLNKIVIIYLAGLLNHKAKRIEITNHRRLNWATYGGFSIGELKKQGDWAFDANYQAVAPQAYPDFDNAGIGLGNAGDFGFYTVDLGGTGAKTTRANAAGNTNFRGYQLTLQYLLTNTITLYQSFNDSRTLYSSVGPYRRYKQYEIEFIYGF